MTVHSATDRSERSDKRERILLAAERIFARHGFFAARVSEIAKEAGVADGTIYLYFKSKDDLLISLFEQRMTQVNDTLRAAIAGVPPKDQLRAFGLSRLREATEEEYEALTSRNVLTRLERLSKSGVYPESKGDYEWLCEYVHPNFGMNMLHVVHSPVHDKLLRFSLTSTDPFERALADSAGIMVRAALGTLAVMEQLQPPFGTGEVTHFR